MMMVCGGGGGRLLLEILLNGGVILLRARGISGLEILGEFAEGGRQSGGGPGGVAGWQPELRVDRSVVEAQGKQMTAGD
jgi:hypothetical protein